MPWLVFLLAWIGNCGFWLFCFNRVNAFGYPRPVAKILEKVCIALCFVIPLWILWANQQLLVDWLNSTSWFPENSATFLSLWVIGSLIAICLLGPFWIESRRWLIEPKQLIESNSIIFDVHQQLPRGSALNFSTKCLALVPLNEFAHLSVTRKSLRVERFIPPANGLKIGHLSDLHFTGQYRDEHYQFVIERMMELQADMILLSGDIIDYAKFLPMIATVLAPLQAPLGVYFVLGNHDRRLRNMSPLLEQLASIGFQDLGTASQSVQHGDLTIKLFGNERPWFNRHSETVSQGASDELERHVLRIGVSHSPDQIGWARSMKLDLMVAGHTHGGQARFPVIGPLVAPSLYGSKFASGVFYLHPTLMHVSRGVAGTHPLRWRCPPEISLLTLVSTEES